MTAIFSLGIALMLPVVVYVVLNAGTFGLRRQFRFLCLIGYNIVVRTVISVLFAANFWTHCGTIPELADGGILPMMSF